MAWNKKKLAGAVFLLLGLLCWYRAGLAARPPAAQEGALQFAYLEPAAASPADRQRLEEEKEAWYALGSQTPGKTATGLQFQRTREVTLLECLGDPALLLGQPLLSGSYPIYPWQCVIDEETALALWGDRDVAGKELETEDRSYQVSGVVAGDTPLLLTLWQGTGEFCFSFGAYRPGDEAGFPRQELESFFSRCGMKAPDTVSDAGFWARLLRQAALLPLWIPLLAAGLWCLGGLLPGRDFARRWGRRAGLLGIGILAWKLLGFAFVLPLERLPGSWSDFSFWSRQKEELTLLFRAWFLMAGNLPGYLRWAGGMGGTLAYSGLSALLFALGVWLFARGGGQAEALEPV